MLRLNRHSLPPRLYNSVLGILFLFEIYHIMLCFFFFFFLSSIPAVSISLIEYNCGYYIWNATFIIFYIVIYIWLCSGLCIVVLSYDLMDCSCIFPFIPERATSPLLLFFRMLLPFLKCFLFQMTFRIT